MLTRTIVATTLLGPPWLVCVPHTVGFDTDTDGTTTETTSSTTDVTDTTTDVTEPTHTTTTTDEPVCGNSLVEAGEECDDGNQDYTDACLANCEKASCGDGVVWNGTEECDDGDQDEADACTNDCKDAVCGDAIVWAGKEECDDGNDIDSDGCTSACKIPVCGDGIQADSEACDDGPNNVDKTQAQPQDCTTECMIACGDSTVSSEEECDDGGQSNGDGCSQICSHEYVMFVTKAAFSANLGGVAGADLACQNAATTAELPGEYVAWISAGTDSAGGDLPLGKVMIRTDGMIITNLAEDLTKGPDTLLLNPIDHDEDGNPQTGYAWTGTSTQGTFTGADCGGWTAANGDVTDIGAIASTGPAWTKATMVEPKEQLFCDATNHLYCFRKAEP